MHSSSHICYYNYIFEIYVNIRIDSKIYARVLSNIHANIKTFLASPGI